MTIELTETKTRRTLTNLPTKTGRKCKDELTANIHRTLVEAASYAVKLVRDSMKGTDPHGHKVKPISGTKAKLCELAINHAIGTPRQKIEWNYSPGMLTIKDISELARQHDLRDFETLEELAGKVQSEN